MFSHKLTELFLRWYAKRFLHPDIVASYEYIFIWDEDLGVEHFNAEEWVLRIHYAALFENNFWNELVYLDFKFLLYQIHKISKETWVGNITARFRTK